MSVRGKVKRLFYVRDSRGRFARTGKKTRVGHRVGTTRKADLRPTGTRVRSPYRSRKTTVPKRASAATVKKRRAAASKWRAGMVTTKGGRRIHVNQAGSGRTRRANVVGQFKPNPPKKRRRRPTEAQLKKSRAAFAKRSAAARKGAATRRRGKVPRNFVMYD